MARATVTLPQDLLTELLSLVDAKSKTEAVITAVKDEIRLRRAARIKAMAGQMEFTAEAEELRHRDQRLGVDTSGLADCYIAVASASVNAQVATLDSHFQLLAKPAKINLYPFLQT